MKRLSLLCMAALFFLAACNESKTTTEESTQIKTMDSTTKVRKENVEKMEEQTKKVEESLEKLDKEFENNTQ